jgi:hypothetical protein
MITDAPHIVTIDGRLFGYGETRQMAIQSFAEQIAGAPQRMQANMRGRASVVRVSDEEASEVAELIDSPAVVWI